MNKKGISPIIAFVMLMALAVTLGAFVTIWYTKSTESQTKTVIEKFGNADECTDVRFDVAFDYDTTDEDSSCRILVYNLGSFNIDKLKIEGMLMDGSPLNKMIDLVIKPKEGVEVDTGTLEISSLTCLSKIQFAPIIAEGSALMQCINERIFTVDQTAAAACGACA